MDESHKHDFEWKKPEPKEYIMHKVNPGQDPSQILREEWPWGEQYCISEQNLKKKKNRKKQKQKCGTFLHNLAVQISM